MTICARTLAEIIGAVLDLSPVTPTPIRALALRRGFNARHFENSFKLLANHGIVVVRRSPGGYLLNRGLRQITVADVATAMWPQRRHGSLIAATIDSAMRAALASLTLEQFRPSPSLHTGGGR